MSQAHGHNSSRWVSLCSVSDQGGDPACWLHEQYSVRRVYDLAPCPTWLLERGQLEPVGFAVAQVDERDPCMARLVALWVEPSARGIGCGHALVRSVRAWAADGNLTLR